MNLRAMKKPPRRILTTTTAVGAVLLAAATHVVAQRQPASAGALKAALTVTTATQQEVTLARRISANGNIAAWQEASIGTEANGLRLAKVLVGVGDVVKRGQVLATFAADTVQADLRQTQAAVAEAEAHWADAKVNAQRASELATTGALSEQQINQYLTAERTAKARLNAQHAAARVQELRLRQTHVLAPDDGVISARYATVGAVLPAGQELFRLIRQGRLEWRAEVPSAELARIKVGMAAHVTTPSGSHLSGKVRMVAPTVDDKTRNGLVYVDLPSIGDAKAGMFARGDFDIGSDRALTLPQSAVLIREGFSYVMRVGPDARVTQVKVSIGRHAGDKIEITSGLDPSAQVVASGGAFLSDGDVVHVVPGPAAPAAGR